MAGEVILRTDARVRSDENIVIVAQVDYDSTGTVDEETSITIDDGVNEYELTEFEASGSHTYLWETHHSSQSVTGSGQLHAVEYDITTQGQIGSLYARHDGLIIEIPVYDPADLSDSRLRTRTPDGTVGAVELTEPDTEPIECRTPDGAIHGIVTGDTTSVDTSGAYSESYGTASYGGSGD